jgi:hypothetical protein
MLASELFNCQLNTFLFCRLKNPDGTIEAKLRCAFRRSDLSPSLLSMLEKRYAQYFSTPVSQACAAAKLGESTGEGFGPDNLDSIDPPPPLSTATTTTGEKFYNFIPTSSLDVDLNRLKHHELFYSKYIESNVSVQCFRGKLNLSLFIPDVNSPSDFLDEANDNFFYQIAYDPNLKLLSADKIEIRVGSKFQAEIPPLISSSLLSSPAPPPSRKAKKFKKTKSDEKASLSSDMETLVWSGEQSAGLGDISLKKYLKKIIDTKLISNEKLFKGSEVNQSRDSIMVGPPDQLFLKLFIFSDQK